MTKQDKAWGFLVKNLVAIIGFLILAVVSVTYGSITSDIATIQESQKQSTIEIKAEIRSLQDTVQLSVIRDTIHGREILAVQEKLKEHVSDENRHSK